MHRRAAAARSRLPRIRRHHPAGPGPDRLGNRSDGPAPGLAGRRRLGKGRIRRIGPQGMEPPRQCHALFDHQGLQRDPAPARSRERTTHPDARRGERPQERSFVGGLLHERHRRGGNDPQTAMEWVVWRSSTTFIFDDKIEVDGQEVETADVHADVRIK